MKTKIWGCVSAILILCFVSLLSGCAIGRESKAEIATEIDFSPERVGELHNVVLDRIINEYEPQKMEIRSIVLDGKKTKIGVINTVDLIEYVAMQPELKNYVDDTMISEIILFFREFEFDDNSQIPADEQFMGYLNGKVEEVYGVGYEEIMSPVPSTMTRSKISSEKMDLARQYGQSVLQASQEYWSSKSPQTRAGGTSLADMGGALWGLFFGPIGSIIAGGISSYSVDHVVGCGRSLTVPGMGVEIWKCNPKWI